MSDEYIRKQEAIHELQAWQKAMELRGRADDAETYEHGADILHSIPAADVRENVKGEWIVDDPRSEHCSNCGHEYYITSLFMVGINDEPPFCPNCGADMRGEA